MSSRWLFGAVLLGVLTVLSVAPVPASAQARATTADLSGVVSDQSNAVVPGATVTARNMATGAHRVVVTGPDGRYTIAALTPGTYSVTAALAGFISERDDNVTLALGQAAELDFTLRIAGTKEEVTVVAEPTLASVRQTAVATVVTARQIETLPTNGRNFISFSLITPGVNTDRTPQQGPAATSGLTFAGQRARSNNITVDGLDNNDIANGAVRAGFSQEAVQEFQVVANSFSAEFGKASGGIINIVTKSGANTVAGNLFTYFRHEALNAKEHFEKFDVDGNVLDQPKAPYRQYQLGGTVGGPIRRNRAFFFLSAERLRIRANNFVNINDTDRVTVAGQDYGTVVDILRRDGFPIELGHVPYRVEADQVLTKADSTLTANHRLTLRFNWADFLDENAEPWGGQVARSRGAYLASRDFMGAALLTSVFSSRTVNELRFQPADRSQQVISLDPKEGPALDIGAIKVGRQGLTPQPRDSRLYQVVDTLSHSVKRHDLKAGVDLSYVDFRSFAIPYFFGGRYVFQPVGSLTTPEQALAVDRPSAYMQGYGNPSAVGWVSHISLFAQDDWRVRDRVTLKLGVRYENQFFPRLTESVYGLTYNWPRDNDDVAPRFGVSWVPFRDKKTSVHGAYGVFYDHHVMSQWVVPVLLSGTADHERIRVVLGPGSVAAWNAPGRRLPEPTTPYPSYMVTIDPRLKTPYAHHVSFGVNRAFTSELALSAGFVYVRGVGQLGVVEYNPVTNPATGGRPFDVNGVPRTSASVSQYTSWSQTWYGGLMVSVRKRFGRQSGFEASYTLSKAEDLATDHAFSQPQDNGFGRNPADPMGLPLGFNPTLERASSLQDQRHRLVVNGMYALPGGVTVSGIVTVGSGRPFTIVAGTDLNGDGDFASDRPWRVENDLSTRIGRNAGLLAGTSSVDLRVDKQIALDRRAKLDLIVEMFNLLNHTNYTQVDAVFGGSGAVYPDTPTNPRFGRYNKAAPPFQAQLAAKVSF